MINQNFLLYLASILFFINVLRNTLFWLALWQIKEYRVDRMWVHFKETKQGKDIFFGYLSSIKILGILFYLVTIFDLRFDSYYPFIVCTILLISTSSIVSEIFTRRLKRPPMTPKIIIIFCLTILVTVFMSLFSPINFFLWILLLEKFVPLFVAVLMLIFTIPAEFSKDATINKSIKKMNEFKKVTTIGVTGSYGKGSVKEYMSTILSQRFNILKTPATFNTPIGIARTILSGLNSKKEIFIVEMGAYKIGEIAEMASMVKPKIGILTSVNDQHLSLFGSIDKTKKAKYELIESLPSNGQALFNGNNQNSAELFEKTKKPQKILYYTSYDNKDNPKAKIIAKNLEVKKFEVFFNIILECEDFGRFSLKLSGSHNVENVLPGVYVAYFLGMDKNEIKKGVERIRPFSKTMEPYTNVHKTVLIDDTFNANVASTRAAIEYLKVFKGKKALVLQPMIELGKNAYNDHVDIAVEAGKVCDVLFLTSKDHFKAINEGIKKSGGRCEVIVASPREIASKIEKTFRMQDGVVFEGKGASMPLSFLDREKVYS